MIKKSNLVMTLVGALGFGITANAFAYGLGDFFAPVPKPIQQAMSGLSIGAGRFHQNYAEHPSAGSSAPNPMDTQTGNITAYHFGFSSMGGHLGFNVAYDLGVGNTNYDGYLRSVNRNTDTVSYTPYSTTTHSLNANLNVSIRGGFSPTQDFAVIPDLFIGRHGWHRDIQGPYGYNEDYYNNYYGAGITLAGAVPNPNIPLVMLVKYKYGRTYGAHMTSNITNSTAYLGSKPWKQYGVELDYTPWSHLTVYMSYTHTKFKYGQSQVMSGGLYEPNSTTKQDVTLAGIKYRF